MHASNKASIENLKHLIYPKPPNMENAPRMARIALGCEAFMRLILENVPECADRSTALRDVRSAAMWASTAIAMEE